MCNYTRRFSRSTTLKKIFVQLEQLSLITQPSLFDIANYQLYKRMLGYQNISLTSLSLLIHNVIFEGIFSS